MGTQTMAGWLQYEPALRVAVLLGMLGLMAGWEVLAPRRALSRPRRGRWFANLGLIMISVALLRLALPAATVGVAILAQERGWGFDPREAFQLGQLLLDARRKRLIAARDARELDDIVLREVLEQMDLEQALMDGMTKGASRL